MQSNGTAQLIFGPLPQSTYEAASPITVDTTNHHHIPQQRQQQTNGAGGSYNGTHRSSIRWNQAGISTSAERRLPFVHRFRGLPPPAGPPTLPSGQVQASKAKTGKMSTYETNPVGALQERFQSRGISPTYQIIQAEGASHCPTFTFQVFIADLQATGSGNSKKQAKHAAAKAMLDLLDGKERTPTLYAASSTSPTAPVSIAVAAQVACSQVSAAEAGLVTTSADAAAKASVTKEEPVVGNPVGQLQEFCVKHGLPMPVYDLGAVEGQPHQRNFSIACKVGVVSINGDGSSKKEAKRKAAADMLKQLADAGDGVRDLVFAVGKEDGVKDESAAKLGRHLGLDVKASKLQELQTLSLKNRSVDFAKVLTELGQELKFEVGFIDVDEKTEDDQVQFLVQLSTLPVAVCHGVGKDPAEAKAVAARNALCYLKALAKKKWSAEASNVVSNPAAKAVGANSSNNSSEKLIINPGRVGASSNGIKK